MPLSFFRRAAIACFLSSLWLASSSVRADEALDALVAAYPDHLAGHDGNELVFKDGTRLPLGEPGGEKSFAEKLAQPTIRDQLSIPYPLARPARPPARDEDPGRLRSEPFFLKMYGDCRKNEVGSRLQPVAWLPSRGGGTVLVTAVNGVAERLRAVSRELEALPRGMTRYLVPSAGTYNCRPVADTGQLSAHAYGAAIDLATRYGDYWLWAHGKAAGTRSDTSIPYRNRIPQEIVDVFERHGFIWGGRWYHYDTFHFEYRPELIELARRRAETGRPTPER